MSADVLGFGDVLVAARFLRVRAALREVLLATRFRVDRERRQQAFEIRALTRRTRERLLDVRAHELLELVPAALTAKIVKWHGTNLARETNQRDSERREHDLPDGDASDVRISDQQRDCHSRSRANCQSSG